MSETGSQANEQQIKDAGLPNDPCGVDRAMWRHAQPR
jgi:hypothetical protein